MKRLFIFLAVCLMACPMTATTPVEPENDEVNQLLKRYVELVNEVSFSANVYQKTTLSDSKVIKLECVVDDFSDPIFNSDSLRSNESLSLVKSATKSLIRAFFKRSYPEPFFDLGYSFHCIFYNVAKLPLIGKSEKEEYSKYIDEQIAKSEILFDFTIDASDFPKMEVDTKKLVKQTKSFIKSVAKSDTTSMKSFVSKKRQKSFPVKEMNSLLFSPDGYESVPEDKVAELPDLKNPYIMAGEDFVRIDFYHCGKMCMMFWIMEDGALKVTKTRFRDISKWEKLTADTSEADMFREMIKEGENYLQSITTEIEEPIEFKLVTDRTPDELLDLGVEIMDYVEVKEE